MFEQNILIFFFTSFLYFIFIFVVPGFFITAAQKNSDAIEMFFISAITGIITISSIVFISAGVTVTKVNHIKIFSAVFLSLFFLRI